MPDFIDLIALARTDPTIVKDPEKLGQFELTSAELAVFRKLDPDMMKVLIDAIEARIRRKEVASSQACTGGTFACAARPALERV